jgi:aspartate/methionine/tyrosine aminotransferase
VQASARRVGYVEVPNIYTVVDRSDTRTVGAGSAFELSRSIALLLLPGDVDESEQQERFDYRERSDRLVACVDAGETLGPGGDERRDPGVPSFRRGRVARA